MWRNPELTTTVPVRPDGKISTPLVEDMIAVGKTPSQLARDIEKVLAEYIRQPQVNIIVSNAVSTFSQVKVIGQVTNPQAIPYREGMTVLDAVLAVGGLATYAAGNRAKLVRSEGGTPEGIQDPAHGSRQQGRPVPESALRARRRDRRAGVEVLAMLNIVDQVKDELRGAWRFRWTAIAIAWVVSVIGWWSCSRCRTCTRRWARVYVDTRTPLRPLLAGVAAEQDVESQIVMVRQALLGRTALSSACRGRPTSSRRRQAGAAPGVSWRHGPANQDRPRTLDLGETHALRIRSTRSRTRTTAATRLSRSSICC